jgi:hypothetical protein
MPRKIFVGDKRKEQYSLVEASNKKWTENGSNPNDDEYELPTLKYNANQDKLTEQKEKPRRKRNNKL